MYIVLYICKDKWIVTHCNGSIFLSIYEKGRFIESNDLHKDGNPFDLSLKDVLLYIKFNRVRA